jgi:hypothetical protein
MSIAVEENKDRYLALMREFVAGRIKGDIFQKEFLDCYRADLAQDDQMKAKWTKRHDIELMESRLREELSSEEFNKRWHELFDYKETKWLDVYERVFRDVDRFEPDPARYDESKQDPVAENAEYCITEEELRVKVRGYLQELDSERGE